MDQDSRMSPDLSSDRSTAEGSTSVDLERVIIEPAERTHIVQVSHLTAAFYSDPTATAEPAPRHPWADAIERDPSAHGFAARLGDVVCGYAVVRVRGAEAELCYLLVEPQFRNQGVGTKLLGSTLAWLRGQGCSRIDCWAMAANEPALRMYRALGFKPWKQAMRADLAAI